VLKETKEALCEACIRANAPRVSPSGSLPAFEGLCFLDIWHISEAAYFGGQKTVVGVTHYTSGLVKSVPVLRKSQAADAMRIIIHYFNSAGKPITITWIHTDGARELKGAGMIELANEHKIRITTSNVGNLRQNKQEPTWRATCAAMRAELAQSGLPHSFWLHAFSHAEQGCNTRPSRTAPFDTRLGRLLGRKPKGVYRRPFGCLCYVQDAPRYVGGTLVNKAAAQAQRAIHLGYYGDEGSSFENLETKGERAQPGYLYFVPNAGHRGTITVTDSVEFVVDCFTGVKRVVGGGGMRSRRTRSPLLTTRSSTPPPTVPPPSLRFAPLPTAPPPPRRFARSTTRTTSLAPGTARRATASSLSPVLRPTRRTAPTWTTRQAGGAPTRSEPKSATTIRTIRPTPRATSAAALS